MNPIYTISDYFKYIVFTSLILVMIPLCVQSKTIRVIDEKCLFPLPSAKISILDSVNNNLVQGFLTDSDGYFDIEFKDSITVKISYLGYKSKVILIDSSISTIGLSILSFKTKLLTVTGNLIPESRDNSVLDLRIITNADIKNSGSQNLRESLDKLSSINISNRAGFGSSITVNGLSGNQVKILVDGVPVVGRLNGNIDLNQLNLSNIEQIEMVEGPLSALYGTNSFGGVINLITKTNKHSGYSGNFSTNNSTLGQYYMNSAVNYKSDIGIINLSGGRNYISGYSNDGNQQRLETWKPREQYFLNFKYKKTKNNLNYLINSDYFTEKMTSRGELLAPYYVTAFDTYTHTNRFTSSFKVNGILTDHYYLNGLISYSFYQRNRNKYFKDMTTLNEILLDDNDRVQLNNIFGRLLIERKFNNNYKLTLGLDNSFNRILSDRINNRIQNDNSFSSFAIGSVKFNNINLSPALRVNYNSIYGIKFVPTINSKFNINNFKFLLSFAKGYRIPDLKEKYLYFDFSESINILGNEKLLPEDATNYKLSAEYKFSNTYFNHTISLSSYYNNLNNLISTVQINDIEWQYRNIDKQTTTGFNFGYAIDYKSISLYSNFNYNGSNNHFTADEQLLYSPNLTTSLNYKLDFLKSNFRLIYKYSGKINSYQLIDDNIESSFIDDYNKIDFLIYCQLYKDKIDLNLGIKNLLNETQAELQGKVRGYSTSKGADNIDINYGRSFFINLTYNIK